MTNEEIDTLCKNIIDLINKAMIKHPMTNQELPSWLCVDLGLTDISNALKDKISAQASKHLNLPGLQKQFNEKLESLSDYSESLKKEKEDE